MTALPERTIARRGAAGPAPLPVHPALARRVAAGDRPQEPITLRFSEVAGGRSLA